MEGVDADIRPAERDRRRPARPTPERGAAVHRLRPLTRGADDPQGAQPRAGQPRRQLAPRPGREVVEALVRDLPAWPAGPSRCRLMLGIWDLGFGIWDLGFEWVENRTSPARRIEPSSAASRATTT